jgi:hypothetical protein
MGTQRFFSDRPVEVRQKDASSQGASEDELETLDPALLEFIATFDADFDSEVLTASKADTTTIRPTEYVAAIQSAPAVVALPAPVAVPLDAVGRCTSGSPSISAQLEATSSPDQSQTSLPLSQRCTQSEIEQKRLKAQMLRKQREAERRLMRSRLGLSHSS